MSAQMGKIPLAADEGQQPTKAAGRSIARKSRIPTPQRQHLDPLNIALFTVVTSVLTLVVLLMSFNLYFQHKNYAGGIAAALAQDGRIDHAIILTYSRAWDFTVAKTSAIFLSFTLIFTGALYVLRVADSGYKLAVGEGKAKGSLETTSPGLVMVTLGVLLVVLVFYSRSTIAYGRSPDALQEGRPVAEPKVPESGGKKPVVDSKQ